MGSEREKGGGGREGERAVMEVRKEVGGGKTGQDMGRDEKERSKKRRESEEKKKEGKKKRGKKNNGSAGTER